MFYNVDIKGLLNVSFYTAYYCVYLFYNKSFYTACISYMNNLWNYSDIWKHFVLFPLKFPLSLSNIGSILVHLPSMDPCWNALVYY